MVCKEDWVQCECGLGTGDPCGWEGERSETVLVEYMPVWLRESHRDAGNVGEYPYNGAVRLRCEQSCAERLREDSDEEN
jgi:hypothetical protein